MPLTIKEDYFNEILRKIKNHTIGFDVDGCACGRLEIKLNENLYLSIYRSCRKSSTTPNEKLWHIENFEFYSNPYDQFDYPDEPRPINIRLNQEQEDILMNKLREVTNEIWGSEYRHEC